MRAAYLTSPEYLDLEFYYTHLDSVCGLQSNYGAMIEVMAVPHLESRFTPKTHTGYAGKTFVPNAISLQTDPNRGELNRLRNIRKTLTQLSQESLRVLHFYFEDRTYFGDFDAQTQSVMVAQIGELLPLLRLFGASIYQELAAAIKNNDRTFIRALKQRARKAIEHALAEYKLRKQPCQKLST